MQGNNLSGAPADLTWIRRLDRRTKLLLLGAGCPMALLPQSPQVVALATLVVLGHVTLARAWRALLTTGFRGCDGAVRRGGSRTAPTVPLAS